MPLATRSMFDRAKQTTALAESDDLLRGFGEGLKNLLFPTEQPLEREQLPFEQPAAPGSTPPASGPIPGLIDLLKGTGLEHLIPAEAPAQQQGRPGEPQVQSSISISPAGAWFTMPGQGNPESPAGIPDSITKPVGAPAEAPSAPAQQRPAGPIQKRGAFEADPTDLESWAVQEAYRLGIDPQIAVKIGQLEGGFDVPNRQNNQGQPAWGPYQLHINGPQAPYLGDLALRAGIDPRNPRHAKAAITFALEHAAENGWSAWYAAAANGIGRWDGIRTGATAQAPGQAAKPDPRVDTTRRRETRGLTPDQIEEGKAAGLDANTAASICGPAAALAFYFANNGKLPTEQQAWTLKRAYEEARDNNLWDLGNGMHGPAATVELMRRMGVKSTLDWNVDWNRVRSELQAGRIVIVSTPGHYFVAEGLNADGSIDWGNSARILRAAKHRSSFRPEELGSLGMGAPRAVIYMG